MISVRANSFHGPYSHLLMSSDLLTSRVKSTMVGSALVRKSALSGKFFADCVNFVSFGFKCVKVYCCAVERESAYIQSSSCMRNVKEMTYDAHLQADVRFPEYGILHFHAHGHGMVLYGWAPVKLLACAERKSKQTRHKLL